MFAVKPTPEPVALGIQRDQRRRPFRVSRRKVDTVPIGQHIKGIAMIGEPAPGPVRGRPWRITRVAKTELVMQIEFLMVQTARHVSTTAHRSAGIIEPALSKVKMIQFATEASITVLRIDDMIKLHPEEQQQ